MPRSSARAWLAAFAGAALTGCAAGLPLAPTVMVPGAGFDARGQAELVVRTFVATPDGARAELGGATCDVRSILFQTRLETPATLVIPSFGPQSVTLDFSCRAGELTGAAQQGVVTRWVRPPGGWGWPGPHYGGAWGYAGGPWGGRWGGWDGPAYATFDYPDVAVDLR